MKFKVLEFDNGGYLRIRQGKSHEICYTENEWCYVCYDEFIPDYLTKSVDGVYSYSTFYSEFLETPISSSRNSLLTCRGVVAVCVCVHQDSHWRLRRVRYAFVSVYHNNVWCCI